MNISLEEQIEYMREEVDSWSDCYGLSPQLDYCKAILATLEAVRDETKKPPVKEAVP